jgi:Enoyl-(Acyl carrier protein) reductase
MTAIKSPLHLAPYSTEGALLVVIETPKGSHNKYDFDPSYSCLRLAKALPQGMVFPGGKGGVRDTKIVAAPDMLTRFTGRPEDKAALVVEVPMGRLGLSEELANAIVFIASGEASFITGHILNVNGGHTARA